VESLLVVSGTGRLAAFAEGVRAAGGVAEVVSRPADARGGDWTAVLVDGTDADAVELARTLRDALPDTPLVASVPAALADRVEPLMDAGVEDILCEPPDVADLRVRLQIVRRNRAPAAIALRRSNERFALVARALSDAIWDLDTTTGEIEWTFGVRQFGYALAQAGDLSWWKENLHPDARDRVYRSLEEAIAAPDREFWQEEYLFRHADGSWVPVLDRGVVLRDASGRARRMVGAMTDVSDRHELEARLQLADRMATVGTLAAGIAHEINNPLAYVLGNLEIAREAVQEQPSEAAARANRALDAAAEGAGRIAEIVRDMRAFSRPEDEGVGPVDVRRVLQSVVGMVQNEIRHRAIVATRFEDVPEVRGNGARLGQLFLNLLTNAAQAIPEGESGHSVRVWLRQDEHGDVLVDVSDTGVGILPEHAGQVFVPFFTTKQGKGGIGLGLSISHGIVTSLGGEISVESEPGKGTTFRVLLRRAERREAPRPPSPGSGPERRRVLVIDDEQGILDVVGQMLRAHEVAGTLRAEEALAWIDAGQRYDLVLCDLMMPDMTGMDFFAALSRRCPELAERVVFITGGAFTPRARAFLDAVPNRLVEKPFRAAELRALVGQARA
jgi:PAS domain S-box-containing protein